MFTQYVTMMSALFIATSFNKYQNRPGCLGFIGQQHLDDHDGGSAFEAGREYASLFTNVEGFRQANSQAIWKVIESRFNGSV